MKQGKEQNSFHHPCGKVKGWHFIPEWGRHRIHTNASCVMDDYVLEERHFQLSQMAKPQ